MSTKQVFQQFFVELVNMLPMHDPEFLAQLLERDLLPDNLIKAKARAARADKAADFLYSKIYPDISFGNSTSFNMLLDVMKNTENDRLKALAEKIEVVLKEEVNAAGGSASVPDDKKEDKLKQEIIEALLEARDANHSILVRYGKVLFCGAGGTGKSNFLNLLMKNPFEPLHKSTDLSKPQQVTMKAQVSDEVEFEKMDIDKEILQLTRCLQDQQPSQSIATLSDDIVEVVPSQDDAPTGKKSIPTADNEFALFNVDPNQKISAKPGKIWDILTFVDTGGQPQFINMLPVVNSFAMITFIVHDMCNGLHKLVEVKHKNEKGEDYEKPYEEKYTNLVLIKTLMSCANSIILPDYKFLKDLKEKVDDDSRDCRGKTFTLISLVGTHSGTIPEEGVDKIDEELVEVLKPSGAAKNVHPELNENYTFLVPVDNEKQSEAHGTSDKCNNKQFTDPSKIRKHIYTQLQKQEKFPVPIRWLLLELEIRKKCGDKKFISYMDVLELSKEKKLGDEDDVKKALNFYHLFGVLLYFEKLEGMKDLIITDHKWLFEKLTKIVVYSKIVKPDTEDERVDLKVNGILTKAVLDELKLDADFEMAKINIKNPKKAFLELLKYLRIVAVINETDEKPARLFMPVLLEGRDLSCVQEKSPQASKKNGTIPLLIQFKSSDGTNYLFPRGVFCFLVVELINSHDSEPCEQAYNNFITLINEDMSVYITLIDRISVLEVQVVPITEDVNLDAAVHGEIYDMINNSLVRFGEEFNISVKLNYGFICKSEKCSDKELHISCVKKKKNISYCINKGATTLCTEHNLWLENFYKNTSIVEDDETKGTDVSDVSNLIIGVDYHYLLWQELNKTFGASRSSIFVMEVGKKLCFSDYAITHGHADLAAYNTFQLVDCTISCATNYTPNGSSVSEMWKKLLLNLEGSGETTDHMTVLKENARSVKDYSGQTLNYYHVSMIPKDWYQWFDSSQPEKEEWAHINVNSKNHYADQADLYKELGGSVKTSDKCSDVEISLKYRSVQIIRPWLVLSVLNNKLIKIPGHDAKSWSTGELNASNKGWFPLLTTRMIVAKDIRVTSSTKMEQNSINDACSLFGVPVESDSYEISNNSIELKGTQVIGYVCTLVTKFPH